MPNARKTVMDFSNAISEEKYLLAGAKGQCKTITNAKLSKFS